MKRRLFLVGNRACSLSYTGRCKTEKSFPVKIENYFILCVRICCLFFFCSIFFNRQNFVVTFYYNSVVLLFDITGKLNYFTVLKYISTKLIMLLSMLPVEYQNIHIQNKLKELSLSNKIQLNSCIKLDWIYVHFFVFSTYCETCLNWTLNKTKSCISRTLFCSSVDYHCEFEPHLGEMYSIQHYVIKFVSEL